jgi:hypothetical protein
MSRIAGVRSVRYPPRHHQVRNPLPVPSELALDHISVKTAVTEWFIDEDAATTKHSPIACWNTAEVTDMDVLLDDFFIMVGQT